MQALLILAVSLMTTLAAANDKLLYVGIDFAPSDAQDPASHIQTVVQTAQQQQLVTLPQDTISIFNEDGSSVHASRLTSGEPEQPLRLVEVSATPTCVKVADPNNIEAALRDLDARNHHVGPAYLRTTFDVERGMPVFVACRDT